MTAREVVELIKKNSVTPWNERSTRDTFKAGDPDVTVKGTSAKGTRSTDVFSLKGLAQALDRSDQDCK